jgi:hypothetical protein
LIQYIHSATLMVRNQDAAIDFYVEKLSWEKRVDSPYGDGARWVEVGPQGAATALALLKPYDVSTPPETAGDYKGISSGWRRVSLILQE